MPINSQQGLLELFNLQKLDLATLYGPFPDYKSFDSIIQMEHEKWLCTDSLQKQKLEKLTKGNKNMTIDDWIIAVTSWGISPDIVQQFTNQQVPGNLYYEIANRQEQIAKATEVQLYDTTHLQETESTYYNSHELGFESKVLAVLKNRETQKTNIVIMDKSPFYPTSGGQAHDTGFMVIGNKEQRVVNVEKVGKCVLHYMDLELG
jgi:alanyl-tRNA synthetase